MYSVQKIVHEFMGILLLVASVLKELTQIRITTFTNKCSGRKIPHLLKETLLSNTCHIQGRKIPYSPPLVYTQVQNPEIPKIQTLMEPLGKFPHHLITIIGNRQVTCLNLGTTFQTTEKSASGECVTPPPCQSAHNTFRNSSTTDLYRSRQSNKYDKFPITKEFFDNYSCSMPTQSLCELCIKLILGLNF